MKNKSKNKRRHAKQRRMLSKRQGKSVDGGARIDRAHSGPVDQAAITFEKLVEGRLPVRRVEQILLEAVDSQEPKMIRLGAQAMIDLDEADDEMYAISAMAAMRCMLPQIALKHALIAAQSPNKGPMVAQARRALPDLAKFVAKIAYSEEMLRLYSREELNQASYLNDRVMELMAVDQFGLALRRVQRALKSYPLYLPLINNFIRLAMQAGQYESALASSIQSMEHFPNDAFAVGNSVLLWWINGEVFDSDAELAAVAPIQENRREGLSYLLEVAHMINLPERLIDSWESNESLQDKTSAAYFAHDALLVAWAYGRCDRGEDGLAVLKRTENSLRNGPYEAMIEDLNRPFEQRIGANPIGDAIWLPQSLQQQITSASALNSQDAKRQLGEIIVAFITQYPRIAEGVLDRGPLPSRRAFIQACSDAKSLTSELLEILQSFAEGRWAPLTDRLIARSICEKHGRKTTRLWAAGWMSEEFVRIELHSDSRKPDSVSDEVNQMSINVMQAINRYDGKAAEELCRKILKIDPLRSTRISLITALVLQDRMEEADRQIESLYHDHPDYWFAKVQWITYLLRRNQIAEAKSLLDSMPTEVQRWHTSEANAYGQAKQLIATTEERIGDVNQFRLWNQACAEFERAKLQ